GNGAMVVGTSASRAFLWRADIGMVDLSAYLSAEGVNLSGWVLTTANAVSADGLTLVGYGQHNGVQEAFVVTLAAQRPPNPGPFDLLEPPADAAIATAQPTLTWMAASNAVSYTVTLSPVGGTP